MTGGTPLSRDILEVEILIPDGLGFCFGVKRAYDLATSAVREGGRIFCWGPLIHNPQVVSLLEGIGLRVVEEYEKLLPGDRVIIRSHGASPRVLEALKKGGVEIIDATCPFVKKAQERIAELARQGYQVLLLGDPGHAEVQALLGYAGSHSVFVIGQMSDLNLLQLEKKVGIVSQTTQQESSLRDLVATVLPRVEELRVFNTICDFTASRLKSSLEIAGKVEVMLVVGGEKSANTRRLRDACQRVLPSTYLIERPDQIRYHWVRGKSRVGVTAGASTPDWIVSEVVKRLRHILIEGEDEDQEGP